MGENDENHVLVSGCACVCVCAHSGLKTKENSENGNVSMCRFTFINFWEQFYVLKLSKIRGNLPFGEILKVIFYIYIQFIYFLSYV